MVACRFYQNLMRVSIKNSSEMIFNIRLMDGILTQVTKITYLSVPQTRLIYLKFFKRFQTARHSGKINNRHLFATLNSQGEYIISLFLS